MSKFKLRSGSSTPFKLMGSSTPTKWIQAVAALAPMIQEQMANMNKSKDKNK